MMTQTRLGHLQKQLSTYQELSSSYTDLSELVSKCLVYFYLTLHVNTITI